MRLVRKMRAGTVPEASKRLTGSVFLSHIRPIKRKSHSLGRGPQGRVSHLPGSCQQWAAKPVVRGTQNLLSDGHPGAVCPRRAGTLYGFSPLSLHTPEMSVLLFLGHHCGNSMGLSKVFKLTGSNLCSHSQSPAVRDSHSEVLALPSAIPASITQMLFPLS